MLEGADLFRVGKEVVFKLRLWRRSLLAPWKQGAWGWGGVERTFWGKEVQTLQWGRAGVCQELLKH